MLRRTLRRLFEDPPPFGGGLGSYMSFGYDARAQERMGAGKGGPNRSVESPILRLDPSLYETDYIPPAKDRELASMTPLYRISRPNYAKDHPAYRPSDEEEAAEESGPESIGEARDVLASLKAKQGSVPAWRTLEAEINLIIQLISRGSPRDCTEATKRGDAIWTIIESGRIQFPENFVGPSTLCEYLEQGCRKLKDNSKAEVWKFRSRQLKSVQYAIFPDEASTAGHSAPEFNSSDDLSKANMSPESKERAHSYQADPAEAGSGDPLGGRRLVRRRAGAFHYNRQGKEEYLFHRQNPLFDNNQHRKGVGVTWEKGDRFTR